MEYYLTYTFYILSPQIFGSQCYASLNWCKILDLICALSFSIKEGWGCCLQLGKSVVGGDDYPGLVYVKDWENICTSAEVDLVRQSPMDDWS